MNLFKQLDDKQLLDHIFENNQDVIVYFFYIKYLPTFEFNIKKNFFYKIDIKELIDEFYIYLSENNWKRLKTYNFSSSLNTWISVVSYRFFKNYKLTKIDSYGLVNFSEQWDEHSVSWVQHIDNEISIDVKNAILDLKNSRDQKVASLIFLEDEEINSVAEKFNISIDYAYTVKNRIVKFLRLKLNTYTG